MKRTENDFNAGVPRRSPVITFSASPSLSCPAGFRITSLRASSVSFDSIEAMLFAISFGRYGYSPPQLQAALFKGNPARYSPAIGRNYFRNDISKWKLAEIISDRQLPNGNYLKLFPANNFQMAISQSYFRKLISKWKLC
jgi:hypothetical protein